MINIYIYNAIVCWVGGTISVYHSRFQWPENQVAEGGGGEGKEEGGEGRKGRKVKGMKKDEGGGLNSSST